MTSLTGGWTNIPLSRALSGVERTPVLRIRPAGGIGRIPPFSLGAPQPLSAFRVQTVPPQRNPVLASLALRCWSGLPGVAPPNITRSLGLPVKHLSAVRRVPIPLPFLRDVEWINTGWNPDFVPVAFVHAESALQCHPPLTESLSQRFQRCH
jgi:hypothetical protein